MHYLILNKQIMLNRNILLWYLFHRNLYVSIKQEERQILLNDHKKSSKFHQKMCQKTEIS